MIDSHLWPAPRDKLWKGDREQSNIEDHNDRLRAMKELNEVAFEHRGTSNRPSRANTGFAHVKSKGWR